MADKDKASGMKSAYELALERMEKQGIERPREESFGDELRGEDRRRPGARPRPRLAELEILHKNRLKIRSTTPPSGRKTKRTTTASAAGIEEERERKIEELRKP